MIVLDTNVISEPWRPTSDPHVLAWIDAQAVETLYLSAITVAELRFGIAAMPAGKRRTILHTRLEQDVLPVFAGRVLPFDLAASQSFAGLMSAAKAAGKAISTADGYIAASALIRGFTVATRDTSPFAAAGLKVVNPWQVSPPL
jgi:toxin FitB